MIDISQYADLGGVPIVIVLVEVAKRWITDSRAYPLLALVFGVAWTCLIAWSQQTDISRAIVVGFLVGILASGLWSADRTVLRGE